MTDQNTNICPLHIAQAFSLVGTEIIITSHELFQFILGEVMVIVEYCCYGNVQNFLIKHRNNFIDQIVRSQDIIDPNITTKEQSWSGDSGYEYYNRYACVINLPI